jgi:hypothetical protein
VRATAVLIGALVALAVPAGTSAKARHHGPASFDGSCEFVGPVTFTPPMTMTPQPTSQYANAPGTCTGTFVDRDGRSHQLNGATARDRALSSGDAVSCAFGLASGAGTLSFPYGQIAFTMREYRAGATPLIEFDGRAGGQAWMPVTPAPSADPIAALEACNGAGLSQFQLDGHLTTSGAIRG